ncbi:MAG: aminotransferase class V-fold PLP-dependent enzyme [Rhodospirillaceae bacterium]|nr:aminotransferase class V-fold PLP-dependent enzyme [Rhodospirillaceae bacterium]
MTAARYAKAGYDVRRQGVRPEKGRLVGYTSAEAHSCIARTFDMLGLGLDGLRSIPVDDGYRMDIKALRQAITDDIAAGHRPFCVVGSPATVNTGAIDDMEAISRIAQEFDLWFHVDGAFGAKRQKSPVQEPPCRSSLRHTPPSTQPIGLHITEPMNINFQWRRAASVS